MNNEFARRYHLLERKPKRKLIVLVETPQEYEARTIGTACDLWLPGRERYTQGNQYRKIADIFSADGTKYFVLTHSVYGGRLYRKPEQVRLEAKAIAA